MKTKYIIIAAMIVMAACTAKKPEPVSIEFNQLKSEVIEIHDIAMEQMGEMMKLKAEIRVQLDSMAIDSAAAFQSIENLNAAHDGMMVWMRGFADAFSGEILTNGFPEHFENDEEKKEAEAALIKIKEQEESVQRMNDQIQKSIAQAKEVLGKE